MADLPATSTSAYKPFGEAVKAGHIQAQPRPVQTADIRAERHAFSLPLPPPPPRAVGSSQAALADMRQAALVGGFIGAGRASSIEAAEAQRISSSGMKDGGSLTWALPRPSGSSPAGVLPAPRVGVPLVATESPSQSSSHAGPNRAETNTSQPGPSVSEAGLSAPVVYALPTPYKGRNHADRRINAPASSTGSFAPFSAIIRGGPYSPSAAAESSTTGERPRKRPRVASPAFEVVVPQSVPSIGRLRSGGAQPSFNSAYGVSVPTAPADPETSASEARQFNGSFPAISAAVARTSRWYAEGSASRTSSSSAPSSASSASVRTDNQPKPLPAVPATSKPTPQEAKSGGGRSTSTAVGSSGTLREPLNATTSTSRPFAKEKEDVKHIKKQQSFELEVPIYVRPRSTDKEGATYATANSSTDADSVSKSRPSSTSGAPSTSGQPPSKSKGKERLDDCNGHVSDGSSSSSLTPIESSSSSSSLTPLNSSEDEGLHSKSRIPRKRVGPPKWTRLPARPPKQPRTSQGRISYIEPTEEEFLLKAPKTRDAGSSRANGSEADDLNSDDAVSQILGISTSGLPSQPTGSVGALGESPISSANDTDRLFQTGGTRTLGSASPSAGSAATAMPRHGQSGPSEAHAPIDPAARSVPVPPTRPLQRSSRGLGDPSRPSEKAVSRRSGPGELAGVDGSATTPSPKDVDRFGDVVIAANNGLAGDVAAEILSGKHGFAVQTKSCVAWVPTLSTPASGPPVSRCHECISKRTGFICCFQGIRYFPLDAEGRVLPYPVFRDFEGEDEEATLPTAFNEPFTAERGALLRSAIAKSSQSSLNAELEHAERPESVRFPRHLGTTYTCDGCATSTLFTSWMCTTCAREFCRECRSDLETLPIEEIRQHARSRRLFTSVPSGDIGGTNVFTVDKLTRCISTDRHGPERWIPIVRADRGYLRRVVTDMTWWTANRAPPQPGSIPQKWLERRYVKPHSKENSLKYLKVPGRYLPPMLDQGLDSSLDATRSRRKLSNGLPTARTALPLDFARLDKAALPISLHAFAAGVDPPAQPGSNGDARRPGSPPPLPKMLSQLDLFSALWQRGDPIVVDLAPENYPSLPWDPDCFVERFGTEPCRIGSARVKQVLRDGTTVDCERAATVGDFFATFGKVREHSDIEKIKDWPSARDFKVEYPDLWDDFMSMLPAGCVTRRDGALDFAAHMPAAANPPDLGPKGYFSQISDAMPGGAGSTKLHTVNIMLWSSDAPDGTPGVAAWDLFQAEDAESIRDFLYEQIAVKEGLQDAAEARKYHDDPIHAQRFYLDAGLLDALYHSKGVKPYRILQKPGQAIFIPAAVAHQVCNLADCIKVATDFVSVENLDRCSRVTSQFRKQTKDKVLWRTDVLQLKSMLFWAWRSTERFRAFGGGTK